MLRDIRAALTVTPKPMNLLLACAVDDRSNPEACWHDPDDAMYGPEFCHAHGEIHVTLKPTNDNTNQ